MDATQALINTTTAIHPLPEAAMHAFTNVFHEHSTGRKQLLTNTGTNEKYLYFVTEGVQRIFCQNEDRTEATILFTYPFSFGGVLESFMLQQPSKYFYESLSASTFLRASFQDLQQVRMAYPAVEQMFSRGISLALAGILERLSEIQSLGSEEKLRRLFKRSPHIFQIVPQKYLANYLGIDPTNFSKFMNNVKL